MGFNDHIEDDDGFKDFLQEIIDAGCLEPKAVGITKQVIDGSSGFRVKILL